MKKLWKKIREAIYRVLDKLIDSDDGEEKQDEEEAEPEEETKKDEPATDSGDAVPFADLDFCWGGFRGGRASRVDSAEIKGLKVSSDGMSYGWVSGGCEHLGATDRNDYNQTLACLFCRIAGKWRGGKFDWISTSRRTRSFANIHAGYHGWDTGAIERADAYAFVIVSKNGKRRTNVIAQGM